MVYSFGSYPKEIVFESRSRHKETAGQPVAIKALAGRATKRSALN